MRSGGSGGAAGGRTVATGSGDQREAWRRLYADLHRSAATANATAGTMGPRARTARIDTHRFDARGLIFATLPREETFRDET